MSETTPETATTPETTTDTNRTNQLKIYADDDEAAMAEAVAATRGCSVSALGRELFYDEFGDEFGDAIDPADVREGRVSQEDLRALAADEIDPADLDLADEADEDLSERDPESYTATGATPDQLESEGRAFSYDVLRASVADPVDGGLWSEDLEIHPDRVEEGTLRQNHKTASRILAGMARTEQKGAIILEDDIRGLVEDHVAHIPRAMDREEAVERTVTTYFEKTTEHFFAHPLRPAFFTAETFRDAVESLIDDLTSASDLSPATVEEAIRARAFALEHTEALLETTDLDVLEDAPHAYAALLELSRDVFDALEDLDESEQIRLLSEVEPDLRDADLWSSDPSVPDPDYGLTLLDHLGLTGET